MSTLAWVVLTLMMFGGMLLSFWGQVVPAMFVQPPAQMMGLQSYPWDCNRMDSSNQLMHMERYYLSPHVQEEIIAMVQNQRA